MKQLAALLLATSVYPFHLAAQSAYTPVPSESHLLVVTGKSGLLSFLGHEHAILATEWSGDICLASGDAGSGDAGSGGVTTGDAGSGDTATGDPGSGDTIRGSATLTLRTAALEVDSDTARALAGLGDGPGEEDRAEIREKMLGPENLAADSYPEITVRVEELGSDPRSIEDVEELREMLGEDDRERSWRVVDTRATVTVRGVDVGVDVPVGVSEDGPADADGRVRLVGQLEVRQSDFGIEPESVAGVVNVKDEVELRFRIVGEGAAECYSGSTGSIPGETHSPSRSTTPLGGAVAGSKATPATQLPPSTAAWLARNQISSGMSLMRSHSAEAVQPSGRMPRA